MKGKISMTPQWEIDMCCNCPYSSCIGTSYGCDLVKKERKRRIMARKLLRMKKGVLNGN